MSELSISDKVFLGKSDEYDLQMALDSEVDNDQEYTSEEVLKILGLNI